MGSCIYDGRHGDHDFRNCRHRFMGKRRENNGWHLYGVWHDFLADQRWGLLLGRHDVHKRYSAGMSGMPPPDQDARHNGPLHVLPHDADA